MTRVLVRDYETSGVPLFGGVPSEDPRQPHVIQAALGLYDVETRRLVQHFSGFVRPDGLREMPPEAFAVHGITLEQAMTGIPVVLFCRILVGLWARADYRVAHPKAFEDRMERISLKRSHGINPTVGFDAFADEYRAGDSRCTQSASTPIVNRQRKLDGGKSKTASLQEAYEYIVGRAIPGPQHDADQDMRNTADLWFALLDLEAGRRPPPDENYVWVGTPPAPPPDTPPAEPDRPPTLAERFGSKKPGGIFDVDD